MPLTEKRTVAVIGAGPGGLVAAQKLLRADTLAVTIYDKALRIGGLWERNSLINPQMQANFSMFTIAFSDLAWDSVKLGTKPPIYPRAWMVERYLEAYKEKYLDESVEWKLGTTVVSAQRMVNFGVQKWRITSMNGDGSDGQEQTNYFDYLVIATGYLSLPKALDCGMDTILRTDPTVPIMHSTQFRHIEQLYPQLPSIMKLKIQKVLVIGGSHSGSEISTLIAQQASNARWSPSPSTTERNIDLEIIHITNHQMLAAPGFTRDYTTSTCSFQPIEFKLFERATRPPEPISHAFGLTNPEESRAAKIMQQNFVNGELDEGVLEGENPLYCVISETYAQFVSSGVIKPFIGQMKRLASGKADGEINATVKSPDGNENTFEGITAVVNATGFNSGGSLSFLCPSVLNELGFNGMSTRLPFVLDTSYMSQRSTVPDVAVLGFTGVNWGVMEMQARAIARKWSRPEKNGHEYEERELKEAKEVAKHIHTLRAAISEGRKHEIPQVLFGDYIGLMEQGARELHLDRIDLEFGEYYGMVCAARYIDPGSNEDAKKEAVGMMRKLGEVQRKSREEGLFVARAVFHGLLGLWESKELSSCLGKIEFHPRLPTAEGYEFEYLVVENSVEKEEKGKVYRYDESSDKITVWSVSETNNLSAEELLHTLRFDGKDVSNPNSCSAIVVLPSSSLSESNTVLSYNFDFKGSRLNALHIQRKSHDGTYHTLNLTRPLRNVTAVEASENTKLKKEENEPVVQIADIPTPIIVGNTHGLKPYKGKEPACRNGFYHMEKVS